jgi:hypothetical protein
VLIATIAGMHRTLTKTGDLGSSLNLGKKSLGERQGSIRVVLAHFRVVFGQKMTDWTALSVIVNR